MRPYQFADLWIDLDTIQAISEPVFIDRMGFGGYFVEMNIQFAFQDKPRVLGWRQPGEWVASADSAGMGRYSGPKLAPDGRPTKLVEIEPAYLALLEAWCKS